jgi:copper resistance protein C
MINSLPTNWLVGKARPGTRRGRPGVNARTSGAAAVPAGAGAAVRAGTGARTGAAARAGAGTATPAGVRTAARAGVWARSVRRVLGVLAVIAAVLGPGAPAWAHNELIGADPAAGATLTSAPAAVTLRFAQKLNPTYTTIVLSDAAKHAVPTSTPAVVEGAGTVKPVSALANGIYIVAYRIVSLDGHVVQGSYTFTVADPAKPAAAAVPTKPVTTVGDDGVPNWVLIGIAVLGVLLVAGAVAEFLRHRRRNGGEAAAQVGERVP